ncbi:MAG: polynucleotide kinase-phosphatase [Spirochaetaceae bacterium]|nr:polynucleotide kinase-phosphatase [Spirochaetaceae bacterium]|tara:strand:+ start:1624 stop:4167 length:2544 start_codon:yes stop_codon:yes gene_type:complete
MDRSVISFPEPSLVLLVGPSASGKSTFAKKHFKPTEVISSDYCRALVSDDENSNEATADAFEVLGFIAAKRLARGKTTVIDATNVQAPSRKKLLQLARQFHVHAVAIVLNLPRKVLEQRNQLRTDRNMPNGVVRKQQSELQRSLRGLKKEGFRFVYVIDSAEAVDSASIERTRLWVDKTDLSGPFDIIGDVHGCFDEMISLLEKLGYATNSGNGAELSHSDGRRPVFVGDLVDRGPGTTEVLRFVSQAVDAGLAFCVAGNHDVKLLKYLRGKQVKLKHGLEVSARQLENQDPEFLSTIMQFLDGLRSHYVFDGGRLVVAHAGLKEEYHGRASGTVRQFALYGETTGEIDEYGYPVRYQWARDYRGEARVVYGHTPVTEAEWVNRTINIDTGCVFGGKLTALRYPEMTLVDVPAREVYYASAKPLAAAGGANSGDPQLLDIKDIAGKRIITTSLAHSVSIPEEHSAASIESLSRFTTNPQWLIHLPPTMSPSETSSLDGYLERPEEALDYYKRNGIKQVICEEKHMGSRAIIVVCRDEEVASRRFGVPGEAGICYSRTGRRFFSNGSLEQSVLQVLRQAMDDAGTWDVLDTDWICLDTEIMPWSLKAQALLRDQYAAVGAAARGALGAVLPVLEQASENGLAVHDLLKSVQLRAANTERFVAAYRQYCWPAESLQDIKVAPFHILAAEGRTFLSRSHDWHLETLESIVSSAPGLLVSTRHRIVDTTSDSDVREACDWWEELTEAGGEGFVTKPLDFVARGKRGMVQPGIKTRGKDYLRIIYGPDYDMKSNLDRVRKRGLSRKRSLALREFALGHESLERFVKKEPLYRVHECVAGVLALESDPVDPRL